MMKTIVAAFRDQTAADQAIAFLHANGVDDVELMGRDFAADRSMKHLRDFHIPDDAAQLYEDAMEHGAPVIAAHTDHDAEQLAGELDRLGALDLAADTQPRGQAPAAGDLDVIEERAVIGKREVSRGGVRVRTIVSEQPVREDIPLHEEHIDVSRERVDEPISPQAAEAAMADEEFEVTARGEEAVVGKEARVVERVHVGKTADTRTETVDETVRRQDVEVEPIGQGDGRPERRRRR